jgi:hypothetical protein
MRLSHALLAFASLCAAVPAWAEPPIGSRVGERTEKHQIKDERDAAEIAHQLAGCILATRGKAGIELLSARSDDEVQRLNQRVNGEEECIANISRNDFVDEVEVNYPPDILRGDIAEELLKKRRSTVLQLQPLPIQKTYSRSWFAFTGRDVSVDEMATCVAETNPAAIMDLVETAPFSDGEGAAFSKLVPYMGPCLRVGTRLEGKREPLRAALAEALYQRLTNPSESIAGAPHAAANSEKAASPK